MAVTMDQSILLLHSLIPSAVIVKVKEGRADECVVATLVVTVVLQTLRALKQGNDRLFDADIGDGGCQNRALILMRISQRSLQSESEALKRAADSLKSILNTRQSGFKGSEKLSLEEFLGHFEKLRVSKDMEFLMHCFFLKTLNKVEKVTTEGVVHNVSDVSRLRMLSSKIDKLDRNDRRKIMEFSQQKLSLLSMAGVRSVVERLSLASREKELMMTMLSSEETHLFTPSKEYEPKAFGCLFYCVKALLYELRAEPEALVCLKSIVKEGKPFHIFLQAPGDGRDLELLCDDCCKLLQPVEKVVVFEAVFLVDKDAATRLLREYGFTNVILAQSAITHPYEPGSTLDSVRNADARQEILSFVEKGAQMARFLQLDHIYLNSMKEEILT